MSLHDLHEYIIGQIANIDKKQLNILLKDYSAELQKRGELVLANKISKLNAELYMSKVENVWVIDKLKDILGTTQSSKTVNKGITSTTVTDAIKKKDHLESTKEYTTFVDKTVEGKAEVIDNSNWTKMSYYMIIENIMNQLNKMTNVNEIIRGLTNLHKHLATSGLNNRKMYQLNALINELKNTKEFKIIETRTLLRDIQNELK